jgi:hypothetical protein
MKRISIFQKSLVVAGCFGLISAINVGASHAASVTATGTVITALPATNSTDHTLSKYAAGVASGTFTISTVILVPGRHLQTSQLLC